MSTSKHIDKICISAISIALILSILIMCIASPSLTALGHTMGYENRLFSDDKVHKIDIVMDDWDTFIEECENEEYSNCTVLIDGEKYSNIGIRAKGNTSLSSVRSMESQRYSFKLEFDQYEKGKNYYGLDKLCLNNLIQDNTMMKDYLSYKMMNEFGVDAPLCSYAYITVNGEDWGLYLAVEGIEDSFLQRNYGSDSGNLYKPDSMGFGGGKGNGKGFDMKDFDFSEGADGIENSTDNEERRNNRDNKEDKNPGRDNERRKNEKPDFENGQFPNMGQFPQGGMPDLEEGDFDFGQMPQGGMPDFGKWSSEGDKSDENSEDKRSGFGKFGGFGGMGSDDVKLKYIDDNAESYPNIFNNAKTVVSESDKKRLMASLKNLSEYSNLDDTLDVDEVLRYFVVHNFLVNGDSYTGSMIHNYYLHEKDGKLSMIPWDYNLAFGTFQGGNASGSVNSSIDSPVAQGNVDDRPMVGWIFSDEKYTEEYHSLFEEFINEWTEDGKLQNFIEDTYNLIKPYVEKDPTKFCTSEEFEKGVKAIKEFSNLRGEAVMRQLKGDDSQVDTAGLNISDMGTMNMGMDGRFGSQKQNDSKKPDAKK